MSTTTTQPAPGGTPAAPHDAAPIRVCIVGHVDHGKSTLIGRLLMDSGAIHESRLAQLDAIAKRRGGRIEYANLLDAFQAERDQNITIDTGQIWFRATRTGGAPRDFRIVDAPGHREFLKNMVTGAAQADVAVLTIDAKEGVQQQTRSHAWLLAMVDVKRVIVVVNKMDLVDWSEERFHTVRTDAQEVLANLGIEPLRFIPISAYEGANVVETHEALAWSDGPTLLGALAALEPPPAQTDQPLRFVLQDVYRFDERRILAGRVESGTIKAGDELRFWPGNKKGTVATIEAWSAPVPEAGEAGQSIGVTLTEQIFVERGHVGTHADTPPAVREELHATLFWMGDEPLQAGKNYLLKLATQEVTCRLTEVRRLIDAATLEPLSTDATAVGRYEVGEVILALGRPIAVDDADAIAETGRFVIVDGYRIAGGGRATVAPDDAATSPQAVSYGERVARGGHEGSVVCLSGNSEGAVRESAAALERRLFDDGHRPIVISLQSLWHGLNEDLFSDPPDVPTAARRAAEVARLIADAGLVAIVAVPTDGWDDAEAAEVVRRNGSLDHVFVAHTCDADGDPQAVAGAVLAALNERWRSTGSHHHHHHAEGNGGHAP